MRVTIGPEAYQPFALSAARTDAVVVGAVRSIFRPVTLADVLLSARSRTDALADRSAPSPSTALVPGHSPSMPDSASEQVQATETSERYHPLSFGSVVALPDSCGAVVSTSMSSTVALA